MSFSQSFSTGDAGEQLSSAFALGGLLDFEGPFPAPTIIHAVSNMYSLAGSSLQLAGQGLPPAYAVPAGSAMPMARAPPRPRASPLLQQTPYASSGGAIENVKKEPIIKSEPDLGLASPDSTPGLSGGLSTPKGGNMHMHMQKTSARLGQMPEPDASGLVPLKAAKEDSDADLDASEDEPEPESDVDVDAETMAMATATLIGSAADINLFQIPSQASSSSDMLQPLAIGPVPLDIDIVKNPWKKDEFISVTLQRHMRITAKGGNSFRGRFGEILMRGPDRLKVVFLAEILQPDGSFWCLKLQFMPPRLVSAAAAGKPMGPGLPKLIPSLFHPTKPLKGSLSTPKKATNGRQLKLFHIVDEGQGIMSMRLVVKDIYKASDLNLFAPDRDKSTMRLVVQIRLDGAVVAEGTTAPYCGACKSSQAEKGKAKRQEAGAAGALPDPCPDPVPAAASAPTAPAIAAPGCRTRSQKRARHENAK